MFLKARISRIRNADTIHTKPTLRKAMLVLAMLSMIAMNGAIQPLAHAQSIASKDELIKQLQATHPIQAGKITSHFGPRIDPITREQRVHNGIDYAAKQGVPVIATGDGQVIFADVKGDYGMRIDIDHGSRISTLYANLGQILVTKGQRVAKGETIATIGISGRSTGPHVHYEVRENGTPICPSERCAAK